MKNNKLVNKTPKQLHMQLMIGNHDILRFDPMLL